MSATDAYFQTSKTDAVRGQYRETRAAFIRTWAKLTGRGLTGHEANLCMAHQLGYAKRHLAELTRGDWMFIAQEALDIAQTAWEDKMDAMR